MSYPWQQEDWCVDAVRAFVAANEGIDVTSTYSSQTHYDTHKPPFWEASVYSLKGSTIVSARGTSRHEAIMTLPDACDKYWHDHRDRVEKALLSLRNAMQREGAK